MSHCPYCFNESGQTPPHKINCPYAIIRERNAVREKILCLEKQRDALKHFVSKILKIADTHPNGCRCEICAPLIDLQTDIKEVMPKKP